MKNNRIKFEHNTIAWVSKFNAHAQPQMHAPRAWVRVNWAYGRKTDRTTCYNGSTISSQSLTLSSAS